MVSQIAVMDRTERRKDTNSQNVSKRRERPRSDSRRERDLLKQGRKRGCGEGDWGQKFTT